MKTTALGRIGFAALAFLALSHLASPARADFFDTLSNTIQRGVEDEVRRKVDSETRSATRCALGDQRCLDRQRQETQDRVPPAGTYPSRAPGYSTPQQAPAPRSASASSSAPAPRAGKVSFEVTPYPGSKLMETKDEAYTDFERITGVEKGKVTTETLEGAFSRRRYRSPEGRSTFELIRNYKDALMAQGFKTDYECSDREKCQNTKWSSVSRGPNLGIGRDVRYFTGRMPTNAGTAYVSVALNNYVTYVDILETAEMDTGMVAIDASALADGLDRDGKVTLQGIYFDTGLATLKAESFPALEQVGILAKNRPGLKLRIVGHTDSVGDETSNRFLSQQRALAVRTALIRRYGVAESRLAYYGAGESEPVASNDTEDGRAQNRRVELVRQ
ncbi:outer membrane protein OmpA-like peptidoglycan-associated protein [Parvibaculum indicum]|uniref:OmpA family protein n=1 Tax=Parvibaculum indicum TaxID=562969 RepID=UPI00142013FD|nr:OmpA family protein [Parvibaculum indicum]NIJ43421.1 outer membrane protein OmpA-like peptidoglycan-associated protein [Parvibaculum indicum]